MPEVHRLEGDALRHLPHNTEVESALLGAILRDDRLFDAVHENIGAQSFYLAQHQKLFDIFRRLKAQGQPITPKTLDHVFRDDLLLAEVGGVEYLSGLAKNPLSFITPQQASRMLYDLHARRHLITIGQEMVQDAYATENVEDSWDVQIERAERKLYALAEAGVVEGDAVPLEGALKEALRMAEHAHHRDGHIAGVTTGFVSLDGMLGGLMPSDLLILAGRPAMGKTALATNIAYNAAARFGVRTLEDGREISEGAKVLFFSLEMSAEQLASRLMGQLAQITSDRIRRGKLNDHEFQQIAAAAHDMAHVPLFIDDRPALSVASIRQRARRLRRHHDIGLVVIDYLQLLQSPTRRENRVQEMSEITRGLKMVAKELDVPVLALSQLSRQVEQRDDKRPQLSDLRESGSIEQDADVVAFIYRAEYYLRPPEQKEGESEAKFEERTTAYNQRLEDVKNRAELIIAKQRHGPVGTLDLAFTPELTRFTDLAFE